MPCPICTGSAGGSSSSTFCHAFWKTGQNCYCTPPTYLPCPTFYFACSSPKTYTPCLPACLPAQWWTCLFVDVHWDRTGGWLQWWRMTFFIAALRTLDTAAAVTPTYLPVCSASVTLCSMHHFLITTSCCTLQFFNFSTYGSFFDYCLNNFMPLTSFSAHFLLPL